MRQTNTLIVGRRLSQEKRLQAAGDAAWMCRSRNGGSVLAAWAASRGHKVDLDGDDSITADKTLVWEKKRRGRK
jgi:hypothetical protein